MKLRRLPRTMSALRRVLPGRENAYARAMVGRTAEMAAGKDLSPALVLNEIVDRHKDRLSRTQLIEIGRGLERDIPVLEDLGGAA